ncbi:hypothetical protein ACIGW3_26120 [Streptomyces sp. NPDC053499]|uniref:hypothetical protein n=1 Tax=Streptomyces sp. NPDC053499 TaxID=3365707 RepID=UPI0037D008D2
MPWARFDDRFPSNRKVAMLSDRAFRLYVTAVCWSAENLTDGTIKRDELRLISSGRSAARAAAELVERGLWVVTDEGWEIHDYLDYNPSREKVQAERKANAARQERFRQRKNGKQPPPAGGGEGSRSSKSPRKGRDSAEEPAPEAAARPAGGRAASKGPRPAAQHGPIPATFQPSTAALEWAEQDGHMDRLGGRAGVLAATAAFVDWHRGKGTQAADPEALWRKWIREQRASPSAAAQGAFLVPLPGGQTAPSRSQQQRAGLARSRERARREAGGF